MESPEPSGPSPWVLSPCSDACPSLAADSRGALAGNSCSRSCPDSQPSSISYIFLHTRPEPILSLASHFSVSFFSVSLSKKQCWTSRLGPWPAAPVAVTCHQWLSAGHQGGVELAADFELRLRLEISLRFEISLLWQWFHGTGLPSTPLLCLYVVVFKDRLGWPADTDRGRDGEITDHTIPELQQIPSLRRRAWAHPCWDPPVCHQGERSCRKGERLHCLGMCRDVAGEG